VISLYETFELLNFFSRKARKEKKERNYGSSPKKLVKKSSKERNGHH